MNTFGLLACLLLFQVPSPPGARREFKWDWHEILFPATSLKNAKITPSERAALAKAIEAQTGPPDPNHPEMASEVQVKQAVLNANVKIISLSHDEKEPPEVVADVQHFCSPTGNCTLWFFRRTPRGYRLLLNAIGQGFTVQKTVTNGFEAARKQRQIRRQQAA